MQAQKGVKKATEIFQAIDSEGLKQGSANCKMRTDFKETLEEYL